MALQHLRRTRIVCTLGPTSEGVGQIAALLEAGMNVARFNFSHGSHEQHRRRMQEARAASVETGIPVAILLDTKGPEIRTGRIASDGTIELCTGATIRLTTEEVAGSAALLSIGYPKLPQTVAPGNHIYIADGSIDLEVRETRGREVICLIRNGGRIGGRKNVNIPGIHVDLPAVTDRDRQDIRFGIEMGIDFIAASFVRTPNDVLEIRALVEEAGGSAQIIAKIEDQEGIDNIDEIIRVSDGVMIARGDLGVQLSIELIPLAQKRIIERCGQMNRASITATQMLDSMIHNPRPTRAELTDVANAIFDGTDAVMLSGETANGRWPVEATRTLHRIAVAIETSPEYRERTRRRFDRRQASHDVGRAVAKSAYLLASEVGATAIVTPTLHGNTPRCLSVFRPESLIIAVTPSEQVVRHLLLHWGIYPLICSEVEDAELMVQQALDTALDSRYIASQERVVTVAGIPLNAPFPMNSIKVHSI